MTLFYYMRHGLSESKIKNRVDNSKVGLSEEGRLQVQKKKPLIDSLKIDMVFSSPVARTKETAEILFPKKEIQIIPEISECTEEIWEAIARNQSSREKESYLRRVEKGFEKISPSIPLKRVFLVGHGGNFWALSEILGISFKLPLTAEVIELKKTKNNWEKRSLSF